MYVPNLFLAKILQLIISSNLASIPTAEEMGLAQTEHSVEIEQLSKQLQSTSIPVNDKGLSSLVWIATARPNKAVIMVRNPRTERRCVGTENLKPVAGFASRNNT